MSKKMTPGEVLNSVVKGINAGDLDSLMTLYEADACFAMTILNKANKIEKLVATERVSALNGFSYDFEFITAE